MLNSFLYLTQRFILKCQILHLNKVECYEGFGPEHNDLSFRGNVYHMTQHMKSDSIVTHDIVRYNEKFRSYHSRYVN